MDNSIYYFFSATPQVLAAILALFGVFVVFKIKTIKDELIGIGRMLYNEATITSQGYKLSEKYSNDIILEWIRISVVMENINELEVVFKLIERFENPESKAKTKYPNPIIQRNKYCVINKFRQILINWTIWWSAITAFIIVVCLSTFPFYNWIHDIPCLRVSLFASIILCIAVIFIILIVILRKSLKETDEILYPHDKA